MAESNHIICPVCSSVAKPVRHHDHFADECRMLLWKLRPAWQRDERPWDVMRQEGQARERQVRALIEADQWPALAELLRGHPRYQDMNDIIRAIAGSRWEDDDDELIWATFPDTEICQPCNAIDADVKKQRREQRQPLPRWTSFSPEEMGLLRTPLGEPANLTRLPEIWEEKRKAYGARFRNLRTLGVAEEAIKAVWRDRTSRRDPNTAEARRRAMLRQFDKAPPDFRALTRSGPGKDLELARRIGELGWDARAVQSFVYWYHRLHGDPNCRNNHLRIGEGNFVRWFQLIAEGDEAEARKLVAWRRYWQQRDGRV